MRITIVASLVVLTAICLAAEAGPVKPVGGACRNSCRPHEVFVPAGVYNPFFKTGSETRPVTVEPICLSASPITQEEFLKFVRAHPSWRKSRIKALFAEDSYLEDWRDDLTPQSDELSQPVTFVSWFAAGAYCEARGGRLPTVAEWERIAGGGAPANTRDASAGAAHRGATPFAFAMGTSAPELASTGIRFPGVWEWTANFNSALVSGRIGTNEGADTSQFCGDGVRAVDPSDYGAFLRYSFRSSLRANFALKNLGFRCAREIS